MGRPRGVGRPDLADPVRHPGLGRRPTRGPGPAGAWPGRDRGRGQRLPVGPPRRPRGACRRFRAADDPARDAAARRRHGRPRLGPPPVADAARQPDGRRDPRIAPLGCGRLGARRPVRPAGRVRAVRQRLAPDARWLGVGRLELERPARPRGDRFEHRPRQLPTGGPLLRRCAADVPLVRRLPRGHRLERRRRRHHRGLFRDERAVRIGHGAAGLGPGPAPDR